MLLKYASALCLSLVLAATTSFAKPTLDKLKGSYTGTFSATVSGGLFGGTNSGPGTAVFKSKSKGTQGSLTISATDAMTPGVTYSTVITFKKGGKCTVVSIVPGVSDASGSGTWKLKGTKVSYMLTGADVSGSYTVNGTAAVNAKKIAVVGNFTITSVIPGGPTGGVYTFN